MRKVTEYKDGDIIKLSDDIDDLLEEYKKVPRHSLKWKEYKKGITQRMNLYNEFVGFDAFVKYLNS